LDKKNKGKGLISAFLAAKEKKAGLSSQPQADKKTEVTGQKTKSMTDKTPLGSMVEEVTNRGNVPMSSMAAKMAAKLQVCPNPTP